MHGKTLDYVTFKSTNTHLSEHVIICKGLETKKRYSLEHLSYLKLLLRRVFVCPCCSVIELENEIFVAHLKSCFLASKMSLPTAFELTFCSSLFIGGGALGGNPTPRAEPIPAMWRRSLCEGSCPWLGAPGFMELGLKQTKSKTVKFDQVNKCRSFSYACWWWLSMCSFAIWLSPLLSFLLTGMLW